MKYAIVILGGAADEPQPELDGRTPLQAADAPVLAHLAELGRLGEAHFVPADAVPPVPPGADAALLALLGYRPERRYPGRAPLHALGASLPIQPADWCFELTLLSVIDGVVQPTSALRIADGEAEALIRGLIAHVDLPGAVVHPGQPTRPGTPAHLLVDPGSHDDARDWSEVVTHRPDDIAGQPLRKALPVGGKQGERLQRFIDAGAAYLADHELNRARADMGEPPITHLWPWGQGTLAPAGPPMKPWTLRFGLSAAVVSPDPSVRGVARWVGIDAFAPDGLTTDTGEDARADPATASPARNPDAPHDERAAALQLGRAAAAIERYDLTIVHTDAPRRAALDAGPRDKQHAIELADTHLLRPVHRACKALGRPYRLLVTPLHTTLLAERREALGPVPFLVAGHKISHVVNRPLTEPAAAETDLRVPFGHELMEFLLRSGVR